MSIFWKIFKIRPHCGIIRKKQTAGVECKERIGRSQRPFRKNSKTNVIIDRHFSKSYKNFEQGWRNIFLYIEKQILFLLAMKNTTHSIFQRLQTNLFDCNGMSLLSPPWHLGINLCKLIPIFPEKNFVTFFPTR